MSTDITWLIGGPQGSGVETGANIFSRVCAEMGYQVFGKREFYSNIKGEHSYFAVRVADKKIHSSLNDVTVMVSFDAETIFRHYTEVMSGGALIYDSDLENTTTDDVHTLNQIFKSRLHKELEAKNKPFTISGGIFSRPNDNETPITLNIRISDFSFGLSVSSANLERMSLKETG